jgi:hypothetical protein
LGEWYGQEETLDFEAFQDRVSRLLEAAAPSPGYVEFTFEDDRDWIKRLFLALIPNGTLPTEDLEDNSFEGTERESAVQKLDRSNDLAPERSPPSVATTSARASAADSAKNLPTESVDLGLGVAKSSEPPTNACPRQPKRLKPNLETAHNEFALRCKVFDETSKILGGSYWRDLEPCLCAELFGRSINDLKPKVLAKEGQQLSIYEVAKKISKCIVENAPGFGFEERRARVKRMYGQGLDILGWWVLLEVNWNEVDRCQILSGGRSVGRIVPVRFDASLEIVFSWTMQEQAKFDFSKDVPGTKKGLYSNDLIETGIALEHDREPSPETPRPQVFDNYRYLVKGLMKLVGVWDEDERELEEVLAFRQDSGESYFVHFRGTEETSSPKSLGVRLRRRFPEVGVLYRQSQNRNRDTLIFRTREKTIVKTLSEYYRQMQRVEQQFVE